MQLVVMCRRRRPTVIHFLDNDVIAAAKQPERGVSAISNWIASNRLKLTPPKKQSSYGFRLHNRFPESSARFPSLLAQWLSTQLHQFAVSMCSSTTSWNLSCIYRRCVDHAIIDFVGYITSVNVLILWSVLVFLSAWAIAKNLLSLYTTAACSKNDCRTILAICVSGLDRFNYSLHRL